MNRPINERAIKIFPTRELAFATNTDELASLDGEIFRYDAADTNTGGIDLENKISAPKTLKLKVNARVICLINSHTLYNGKLGRVIECSGNSVKVLFDGDTAAKTVQKHLFTYKTYSRLQFPLL